jgi:transposase-like protein
MAGSGGATGGKTGKGQNGGGRRPVDSKVKARVRKLARGGMSRNAIAREVGISPSTVSTICAEAHPPITFDRSAIAAATEAKVKDAKARRAELSEGLLDDVARIREMVFGQIERTHVSVTNGVVRYETAATPNEMKDLLVGMGIAIDKHLALLRADGDSHDLPAVEQFLSAMMGKS